MAKLLQEDDKRGQDLIEGAHDRDESRLAAESGQYPQTPPAANAAGSGGSAPGGMAGRIGNAAKGAGKLVAQYKKPIGLGGGGIGLIIGSLLGLSGFFTTFEAVHTAENLKSDVMKK